MQSTLAPASAQRFPFIEGLRGVAACQVLLLHYCAAFLPVLARVPGSAHFEAEAALSRSPLFALFDGYSSVYLFFVMSGFVLAPSFQYASAGAARLLAKRTLRLFLPVAAAGLLAVALLLLLPDAHQAAQGTAQSGWLAALGHNPLGAAAVARDVLLNSMLTGYVGSSLFEGWSGWPALLAPAAIDQALNAPMWTLHVEFWGSLLVLGLALLRRSLPGRAFWLPFGALALAAGTSHYQLFMLGFLLYQLRAPLLAPAVQGQGRGRTLAWLGGALAALGLAICVAKDVKAASLLLAALRPLTLMQAASDFHWQSQLGAALIFVGVLMCAPLRRGFEGGLALWLGKVSFSVYLLHFPLLLTVGCLVFAGLAPVSYGLACAAALLLGGAATFAAAAVFQRQVDRRSVRLAARMTPPAGYGALRGAGAGT
ncbi:acyltransferase family protein [Pseudoduganella sp. LjRoot289]|uniref:acyltransferase family protein n=1 Tax=Pseudoduganella sp. LjRoot289 TaxID=3342314 RepID=UPI003ED03131